MATIRLTMAQALVRYLAAQRTECDGRTVALFGGVWAIFGHGNVAGIGEALAAHRGDLPTYRAHNEQAMALAAIGYAKAHAPTAHDGLHHVDRSRRHQHDHRGGGRACRSAAGAAAAGRRVRLAPARPGAAAGGELRRRHGIGERLLPPGVALLRSHHAARADPHGTAARDVGADRSGGVRPGDPGAVPGRAGGGVRLPRAVLRHATLACPPDPAGRRRTGGSGGSAAPRQGAIDDRRRRCALLRGDRRRSIASPPRTASRWRRPRRARARCRTIIPAISERSASPAHRRRTRPRKRPMSSSPWARGCRISPPDHGRCSRTPRAG